MAGNTNRRCSNDITANLEWTINPLFFRRVWRAVLLSTDNLVSITSFLPMHRHKRRNREGWRSEWQDIILHPEWYSHIRAGSRCEHCRGDDWVYKVVWRGCSCPSRSYATTLVGSTLFLLTHRYHYCRWEEDTWFVIALEKDTFLDVCYLGGIFTM